MQNAHTISQPVLSPNSHDFPIVTIINLSTECEWNRSANHGFYHGFYTMDFTMFLSDDYSNLMISDDSRANSKWLVHGSTGPLRRHSGRRKPCKSMGPSVPGIPFLPGNLKFERSDVNRITLRMGFKWNHNWHLRFCIMHMWAVQ